MGNKYLKDQMKGDKTSNTLYHHRNHLKQISKNIRRRKIKDSRDKGGGYVFSRPPYMFIV